MNKARRRSNQNYFRVQDSYSLPNVLETARALYGPFGLPLSVCVTKIPSNTSTDSSTEDTVSGLRLQKRSRKSLSLSCCELLKNQNPSKLRYGRQKRNISSDSSVSAQKSKARVRGFFGLQLASENPSQSRHEVNSTPSSTTFSSTEKEQIFGVSVEEDYLAQKWPAFPEFKSYQIESTSGVQFDVMEIGIPYKQSIWAKLVMKTGTNSNCMKHELKSIVLSEKGASLIWISADKTRIVLMSGESSTLSQWYTKIQSDISLTQNSLTEHDAELRITFIHRLRHAAEQCKILNHRIGQREAGLPKFIPNFRAANEALLRTMRFVWHGLGSVSNMASSTASNEHGHIYPTPETSNIDLAISISKEVLPSLSNSELPTNHKIIGDSVKGSLSTDNEFCSEMRKTSVTKFLEEMIQKWETLSSKLKKGGRHVQIMPINTNCNLSLLNSNVQAPPRKASSISDLTHELEKVMITTSFLNQPPSSKGF